MSDEVFDVFDTNNRHIGKASRSQVHSQGLIHRSVHVLLFNADGNLLVQRRAPNKDICPGLWDVSVAEHLRPQEAPLSGALRGLSEELGIAGKQAPKLELWRPWRRQAFVRADLGIIDNEFVQTYRGLFTGKVLMDADEVDAVDYWNETQIKAATQDAEATITPWLLNELNFLYEQKKTAQ